jgi:hypothetical protein
MGDLLFEFTEWIRSTFMVEWALAISDWPLSMWIVTHFWAIPIFQVTHILAMAAAFGAVLMMSLRIWGVAGGSYTVPQAAERYIPWMWWGLLVLLLSGLLMIVGEPVRELINPIFWIKMTGVIVLVLLSIAYHRRITRRATGRGPEWVATGGERIGAFGLVVLWMLIMAGGRWIAYAPV